MIASIIWVVNPGAPYDFLKKIRNFLKQRKKLSFRVNPQIGVGVPIDLEIATPVTSVTGSQ